MIESIHRPNSGFLAQDTRGDMWIRHLYISPGHNYFGHHGQEPDTNLNLEMESIDCVAGRGIRGDRFFNFREDYKGQVTFFSMEVFEDVCRELGLDGLCPSVVHRNIHTEGADLSQFIGRKFRVQDVEFEGICECKPCYWMDHAIARGAERLLQGRGGLRAKVLVGGTVYRQPPSR